MECKTPTNQMCFLRISEQGQRLLAKDEIGNLLSQTSPDAHFGWALHSVNLSVQSILFVERERFTEVDLCRLDQLCSEPELEDNQSHAMPCGYMQSTYLVYDQIKDEQWSSEEIGKECLGGSWFTERENAEIELASEDEKNDCDAQESARVSTSPILRAAWATY